MYLLLRQWKPVALIAVLFLTTARGHCQPIGKTFQSLEARIASSESVARGTITKVTQIVLTPVGDTFQPNGIIEYTITVKIDEVLKGVVKKEVADLLPVSCFGYDKRFEQWMKEKTSLLWFFGPNLYRDKKSRGRLWHYLRLGKPSKTEGRRTYYGPPVFSMDFSVLKDAKSVLAHARAYAKKSTEVLPTFNMRIPIAIASQVGSSGMWNTLTIPIGPWLEERARQLINAPHTFIPKASKMDALSRYQLRYAGVDALRFFKSGINKAIVFTLIHEPPADLRVSSHTEYPIRLKAYEILMHWNADVPTPPWADEITALDLDDTNVVDATLERLPALKNLATLRLADTKVTDRAMKTLSRIKTLRKLYLDNTNVTDAGVKHLRGLTKLVWLGLHHTKVSKAGIADLRTALPKCEIYGSAK